MTSLSAYLDRQLVGAAAQWAPVLSAMPGRRTFGDGAATTPWEALEWSLREDRPALRFAFTIDTARAPVPWVRAMFRRAGPNLPAPLVDGVCERVASGCGLLFGIDHAAGARPRVKAYLYPGPAGQDALGAALCELAEVRPAPTDLPVVFWALDLFEVGAPALKRYLAPPTGEAATAWWGGPLPVDVPAGPLPPHAVVLTERLQGGLVLDRTLHRRVDGDPDPWLSPSLRAAWAAQRALAEELGLRLTPTHVSWMSEGARTLYFASAER